MISIKSESLILFKTVLYSVIIKKQKVIIMGVVQLYLWLASYPISSACPGSTTVRLDELRVPFSASPNDNNGIIVDAAAATPDDNDPIFFHDLLTC